jgi:hypothetical protein
MKSENKSVTEFSVPRPSLPLCLLTSLTLPEAKSIDGIRAGNAQTIQ